MKIRKALETDIVSTGAFYDRVVSWLDNHVNYPKWTYGVYPSEQSAREMTKTGLQYVCEDEDRIIGAFVLNTDPQGDYQKGKWTQELDDGEYMVIHAFALDPDYQGKGYGSEVIRFCINKAKDEGFKAIRLDIVPENIPARKLYEKNSFTYVGDADLDRGIEEIPIFSLFELNLKNVPD